MEGGGNSNQQHKNTTRVSASASGTINQEVAGRAGAVANLSTTNAGDQNLASPQSFRREAYQYMPMINIVRILRRALPHAKIADDANEIIEECVSEFIAIVTTEANEKARSQNRTIIIPEDVIAAIGSLGLDDYVEPLTVFLNKYRTEDPECGTSTQVQLQMAMCSTGQQPSATPMAQLVPPPPPMPSVITGDRTVIVDDNEEVDPDVYTGFTEVIRKYF